jgi:hypothetical protein
MQANSERMMIETPVPTERVVHSELLVVVAVVVEAGMRIDTGVVVVVHEQAVVVVAAGGMQTVNAAEAEASQVVGRYSAAEQNMGIVYRTDFGP